MWEHLKKSRSTQAHISVVKAPLHHRAGMSYSFSAQSRNRKHRALQLSCSHRPFCFYIWIMKQNLPCSYSITLLWKGVLQRTENLYCKRIVNYYWYQVNFTPKNFFFIVEWNSGVNVQQTKITPVSTWELGFPHHALNGWCFSVAQSRSARDIRWVSTSASVRILDEDRRKKMNTQHIDRCQSPIQCMCVVISWAQ